MLSLVLLLATTPPAQSPAPFSTPPGYVAERLAGPPQVRNPTLARFDARGRLFVAETSGTNAGIDERLRTLPDRLLVLDERDASGRFARVRTFADKLAFPFGLLWHNNSLYVASARSLWRFEEGPTGVVRRTEWVPQSRPMEHAAIVRGPFLGPDGRFYWTEGRQGKHVALPVGRGLDAAGARIFRARPDGSDCEAVCDAEAADAVAIAFSAEGEALVACADILSEPARLDAILFALESRVDLGRDSPKETVAISGLLPMVENLGWVSPSGLMRCRSDAFGDADGGVWFSTQVDRKRVLKHRLVRDGAGFRMTSEAFLVAGERAFRPTDILEDADGSLIVVDAGNGIGAERTPDRNEPKAEGGLWRIRRADMPNANDPWGNAISWNERAPADLVGMLDDSRWPVRDRALQELADRGDAAVPALERAAKQSRSARVVLLAVWAANRIESADAQRLVRNLIADPNPSVRLAAIHSAGLRRDAKALRPLIESLSRDDPATRRQAATALGRLGKAAASSPLFEALRRPADPFLEHAVVNALIRIGDASAWTAYRRDPEARVRRAALVVASQIADASLTRDDLLAALAFPDRRLRSDAAALLAKRGEIAPLGDWLQVQLREAPGRTVRDREELRDLIAALAFLPALRDAIGSLASDPKGPPPARLLLLEAMDGAALPDWPRPWLPALRLAIDGNDDDALRHAAWIVQTRGIAAFDLALQRASADAKRSPEARIAALAALAPRLRTTDAPLAAFVRSELQANVPPLRRRAAAEVLSGLPLSSAQRLELAQDAKLAGPLEIAAILSAFVGEKDEAVGRRLLDALEGTPGRSALSPTAVARAFAGFPKAIRDDAERLAASLGPDPIGQRKTLDALAPALKGGDAVRGRAIFFGAKAACSACHALDGQGGAIGPDLSKIGSLRSGPELLESIVFPSNSFSRGYEPIVIETKQGKLLSGIVRRASSDAFWMATADRREVRIDRSEIAEIGPGTASMMPAGLEAQLAPAELRDLMALLQSLRN